MVNLRHTEQDTYGERRQGMLLVAKRGFHTAKHNYWDRLKDVSTREDFAALEECLSVSTAGAALCAGDLGIREIAATHFKSQVAEWQNSPRGFVQAWVNSTGYGKHERE